MDYDREGYEAERELKKEEEKTQIAVASLASHLDHVKTRVELLGYLREHIENIRAELRGDNWRETERSGGIS